MLHFLFGISGILSILVLGAVPLAAEETAERKLKIVSAEAVSGSSYQGNITARGEYGIVHLKVESAGEKFQILPDRPWCRLTEDNGRALYPVFPVSDGENEYWSQADRPHHAGTLEALFLFKGNEPIKLTWTLPDGQVVEKTLTPQKNEVRHRELLREWWNRYSYSVKMRVESDAYPPQIENYLVMMLAERFQFTPIELQNRWSGRGDLDLMFGLLLGAESIRVAMQRDTVLENTRRDQPLNRALPQAIAPPAITIPPFEKSEVTTEPMASHVPADCFYIRCGNFKNFQWLRANLTHWGAMTRDLTALRGWNYGIRDQLEHQLALKETVLSRLFGDTLISDVAIVGSDTFVRAGASIGILFEARDSLLLKIQLDRLRDQARAADPGARETTVKIAGRDVSFLSTPDNTIRAFYAIDGNYHFISTSRTLVEKFFEAGQNGNSLASLDEFLYARHLMPTSREDACFVYLSDPFFRQLVGPKYRVEMTRRTQAVAEIELVHLAQLAAKAEGAEHETIAQLVKGGFLPTNFHIRPDGSQTLMENGKVFDSLRGARGSFLPVADVDVDQITDSELQGYEQFSRYYRSQWERMDPAMLALKRHPATQGRERISIDVHITPYARRHYQSLTRSLGAASQWKAVPLTGDLAQAAVSFGAGAGLVGNQFGFAGVRDLTEEGVEFRIENGRVFETVTPPVYYGLLSQSAFEKADAGDAPEKAPKEKSLSDGAIFFYPYDALNQAEIRKNAKLQMVDSAAQVRVWVNRFAETNLAKVINAHGYLRARRASAGNARFFHVLTEQLLVEPKQARKVAEDILGAEPVCRMGGQYELSTDDRGIPAWQSTAWQEPSYHSIDSVPGSFVAPLLEGFHEASLDFNIDEPTLTLSSHLELEINAPKK